MDFLDSKHVLKVYFKPSRKIKFFFFIFTTSTSACISGTWPLNNSIQLSRPNKTLERSSYLFSLEKGLALRDNLVYINDSKHFDSKVKLGKLETVMPSVPMRLPQCLPAVKKVLQTFHSEKFK